MKMQIRIMKVSIYVYLPTIDRHDVGGNTNSLHGNHDEILSIFW
jgi:hypothetical protein